MRNFHEISENFRYNLNFNPNSFPPYQNRTKQNFDIKKLGGLTQGFTEYISEVHLRKNPECDANAPPLVFTVVGGEYDGHLTPATVTVTVRNVFEHIANNGNVTASF